jgi:hypothetical protein
MLTPERAQAVWAQRGAQHKVEHLLTPEELAHVRKVWNHLPGNSTWMDAFQLLCKAHVSGCKFQPGALVRVAESHGTPAYRKRVGMIREHVPFGKYYVYLLNKGLGEFALHLVDGADLVPRTRDYVCLRGDRIITEAAWGTFEEIKPGDTVDESLYWQWLEAVPPATNRRELMQMGEPTDHQGANGAPRYLTLQKHGEQWIYTGTRSRGEMVDIEE